MNNSLFIQERISTANFLVVGCGALGNEVLKNLALRGAGHLTLVDFDRVEQGNLSRSVLFAKEDVGHYKVDVAARKLREMNPALEVKTICGDVAYDLGLGLVRQADVVFGCVDSRWARYCINRLCMRAGVPWVDGGIENLEGTVRVFVPGRNCYACALGPEGLKDLAHRMPCSGIIRRNEQAGKAPTTSLIASVIGAVQVQEAFKLLHPELGFNSLCGKMFYYEGEQLTTRLVDFQAWDPDCPVHECWAPVKPTAVNRNTPVREAMAQWKTELGSPRVTLHLTGDCFVDAVFRKDNDRKMDVFLPGRAVAERVDDDPQWKGLPFSVLYQREYREIDDSFPYPDLTLAQLGIPAQDVISVSTETEDVYLEMAE